MVFDVEFPTQNMDFNVFKVMSAVSVLMVSTVLQPERMFVITMMKMQRMLNEINNQAGACDQCKMEVDALIMMTDRLRYLPLGVMYRVFLQRISLVISLVQGLHLDPNVLKYISNYAPCAVPGAGFICRHIIRVETQSFFTLLS